MNRGEFLRKFTSRLNELDLDYLARDVEALLFDPGQKDRVLYFRQAWERVRLL